MITRRMPVVVLARVLAWFGWISVPEAQQAPRVAAAANLNFALDEIAGRFAKERGSRVELVFGASGTLSRQIQDGAPFELFLSADEEFPNKLSAAGLTRDAGVVYASGRLALFAPNGARRAAIGGAVKLPERTMRSSIAMR